MKLRPATLALVAFFIATTLFFCIFAPRFATASNVENLMAGYSFVAILAMGQAFPILLRGIDLSIGAILALVGMVVFDMSLMFHIPGYLILPSALVVGAAAGALNGVLIVYLRLQPFIASLSTMAAYRGLVYSISGRQLVPGLSTTPIRDPWITGIESYFDIGSMTGLSNVIQMPWFPLSVFLMIGVFIVYQTVLLRTRIGRSFYTVGGNVEAARLAGINVGAITIGAYAMSGLCAAIAALIMVSRFTTATEALGMGMELTAISAAVIGGVSLTGGVGTMFGPVVGAFLLGVVLVGLTLMGVPQFVQQIITGLILLVALGYDRILVLQRTRRQTTNVEETTP